MAKYLLLLLLFLGCAVNAAEQKGYKIVKPDGTVEFSDQPKPGATEIPLPEAQSYRPPVVPPIEPEAETISIIIT